MLFKWIKANKKIGDEEFDKIYPDALRSKADTHFTPVQVSKTAARLLAPGSDVKVLDIGAGVGKFCTIGSVCSKGYFVGVEQRKGLCAIARGVCERYNLTNVEFIHSNITDIPFEAYNAFYFFNPFMENICPREKINDEVELRKELFGEYSGYVREQLAQLPKGTRLVTYYSYLREVPPNYALKRSLFDNNLKVWEKL